VTIDRISGAALVILALLVFWQSTALPIGTFRQPGPAYIPILLAFVLCLLGVLVAVTGRVSASFASRRWTEWRHAVAILAACAFAVFAIERLGYRLTLVLILLFLLKAIERRGWFLSVTLSLALAFGSFFLFNTLLRVPLPYGLFGF
jgi:putative tricarboxylic transport membrane protein